MTTPKSKPSKHYKHFRKAIAFPFRKLELCRHCRFRAGSFTGLSPRIQVFAHMPCWPPWSFYPKQLRLPVLNESHTNSYTGPRLVSKLRLAALFYSLGRTRDRSIQRKKLYLRMSSVILNTSIPAIYGLWKSSEIVLLTNHSHYVCPCICNA
jgi:hypothetical protein